MKNSRAMNPVMMTPVRQAGIQAYQDESEVDVCMLIGARPGRVGGSIGAGGMKPESSSPEVE